MTPEALRSGDVAAAIRRQRLIVILRRISPQSALLQLVDELADAGVRVFEVTFDAPSAEADLVAVRDALATHGDGPCLVGAGTVLDRSHLEAARRAGADFAVSPLLDTDLVATAVAEGLPFIPGALTPTELRAAWAVGATFVKLFPASAVGPALIREVRGPLPAIEIIPTGGVDGASASAYLNAGAAAVGIGSAIVRADPATRREIVAVVAAAGRSG